MHIREDPKNRKALFDLVDRTAAAGVRLQRETWASMKGSLSARKVVKTPGYDSARRDVLAAGLPEFQVQAQKGIENAEGMIRAAASGAPFQTPNGAIYVTEELVNQVLGGLKGSVARLRLLANPDWVPQAREYRYPEAGVRILSETPFSRQVQQVKGEDGRRIRSIVLTNTLNEASFVCVTYMEMGALWADPDGAVVRIAKSTLVGAGISDPTVVLSEWRQHRSAFGAGSGKTSEASIHASVEVVELRQRLGALVFLAVTTSSRPEATVLREQLEQSTQVID